MYSLIHSMNDLTNGVQSVAESALTVAVGSVATTDPVNNGSNYWQ
ncbi:TPA: hypothetical protein ACQUIL_003241 [Bacillus tropicus]